MATLLLADDSFSLGDAVRAAFEGEDVRVDAVLSGERALASIEADPPAIVLADIGMARVNGYDIASYIKNSASLSHIPVLLLAGPFDHVDEDKARATRCNGVVAKPLEPRLLVEVVRRLLAGERIDDGLLWSKSWGTPLSPTHAAEQAESPDSLPQHFDAALDRLDEAFDRATTPLGYLSDTKTAEFASDVTVLRGNFPARPRPSGTAGDTTVSPAAPADRLDLDSLDADARDFIPQAPPEASPASERLKIKITIGSATFEAEGPAEIVQSELEEFKRLASLTPDDGSKNTSPLGPASENGVLRVPRARASRS